MQGCIDVRVGWSHVNRAVRHFLHKEQKRNRSMCLIIHILVT